MKNNKGFTLIELLAIIVILGLIALAAIPNISKQVKESEKQEQTVLDKKIENAAKLYAAKYFADKIVDCDSSCTPITFTLTNLEDDGLLSLSDDQCTNVKDNVIEVKYTSKIEFNYDKIKDNNCYSK